MGARGAFAKDVRRTVRASLGRFLAIAGITALGCGFFAGLQMCGPDMRAAADAWYDGSHVWDLRVVSTMGWSDDDLARIAAIDGVEAVMGATTVDAMARLGGEQVAVRISTLDMGRAAAASAPDAMRVLSDDGAYLNRLRLTEGRWPRRADECVVCGDAVMPGCGVGSTMELLLATDDAAELLVVRDLAVVGTVTSANYPYTGNFGSTALGAGVIEQYAYVMPGAMSDDAAYTDAFVRVAGAAGYESEGDAYLGVVDEVAGTLGRRSARLALARLADVRARAQGELDARRADVDATRQATQEQLDDGLAKLSDAMSELAAGEQALAAGEAAYAEGMAALERERAVAEARLARAQAELDAGASELAAGEAAYDAGAQELDAARGRLSDGEAELARQEEALLSALSAQGLAAASLDEASSSVSAAQGEVEAGLAKLSDAEAGIDGLSAAQAELAAAEEQAGEWARVYEWAAGELTSRGYTRADVDDAISLGGWGDRLESWARERGVPEEAIEEARALAVRAHETLGRLRQLSDGKAELARQEEALLSALSAQGLAAASLDEARSSVALARGQAEAHAASLAEAADGIGRLQVAKDELAAGRAELLEGEARLAGSGAQLAAGRDRLAAGRAELASGRADATRQLDAARSRLDAGAAELAASRDRLAGGRGEYERGLAEWEAARSDAEAGLADADARLADAQARLDALERPDLYVLDRTKSEGAATYHADTERMDAIAAVFPLIFFLVAALVALTTMTRMVEDERVQIGTYKALGYSTSAIAGRYLAYAASASMTGAVVGVAVLSQVLPTIVTSAYGIIYAVPSLGYPLPVSLPVALSSGGLGVGVTLLATWAAVVASLAESPAALLLPRAPVAGRRILLERIGPLWRRVSFSWKVTCRNIFRYKRRLLMTVVGISGCTALLLVGFGLHDAIWDIIDCHYGPIVHYDTTIGLDASATERDVDGVVASLVGTGEVAGIVRVHAENMQASGGGKDTMRVQVVVPLDAGTLSDVVTLRERVGHAAIAFDDDAVVVTEKLALRHGLSPGSQVVLFEQDATGNVVGEAMPLVVTGVAENYVGNCVYVGRRAWSRVSPDVPVFSTLYASTTPDGAVRADIAEGLHADGRVSTVTFSDETIDTYRTMLSVVDLIVVVLIVSAGALAFIVLYNLTNINIAERVREIASLKVLGFTRREVYAYIFREVFLLAVAGAALGMALGTWLATFVITTAEVDYVMFGRTIHPPSYAYAFAITLAFTALIALAMRRRLDRVDMVESLKSVE